jgi:hypothetical protein
MISHDERKLESKGVRGKRGTKKSKTLTWYWVAVPLIQRDQHAKPGLSGGALRATLSESSSLPSCTVGGGPRQPNSTPFFPPTEGLNTRRCHYPYHRQSSTATADTRPQRYHPTPAVHHIHAISCQHFRRLCCITSCINY